MPGPFMPTVGVAVPLGRGIPPVRSFQDGSVPYFELAFQIAGVSRDSAGVALPLCTVTLFRVDVEGPGPGGGSTRYTQEQQCISDAVTGAYRFNVAGAPQNYRVTWDLAGAPVRAGVSLNSVQGTK